MSLLKNLNEFIRLKGEVEWSEIKEKCDNGYWGRTFKLSNAERRLRESPDILALYENRVIKRYKFKGEVKPEERPIKNIIQLEDRVILYQ